MYAPTILQVWLSSAGSLAYDGTYTCTYMYIMLPFYVGLHFCQNKILLPEAICQKCGLMLQTYTDTTKQQHLALFGDDLHHLVAMCSIWWQSAAAVGNRLQLASLTGILRQSVVMSLYTTDHHQKVSNAAVLIS